jgi:hypothetical protein
LRAPRARPRLQATPHGTCQPPTNNPDPKSVQPRRRETAPPSPRTRRRRQAPLGAAMPTLPSPPSCPNPHRPTLAAETTRDRSADAADEAQARAGSALEGAEERAGEMVDSAREKGREVAEGAKVRGPAGPQLGLGCCCFRATGGQPWHPKWCNSIFRLFASSHSALPTNPSLAPCPPSSHRPLPHHPTHPTPPLRRPPSRPRTVLRVPSRARATPSGGLVQERTARAGPGGGSLGGACPEALKIPLRCRSLAATAQRPARPSLPKNASARTPNLNPAPAAPHRRRRRRSRTCARGCATTWAGTTPSRARAPADGDEGGEHGPCVPPLDVAHARS